MLSLSQTTGYAIQALGCLARCGEDWELAKDISDCSGVPIAYLKKVLAQLREAGLVEAKRGYRGGFTLARPADEITLFEVVEAVEPSALEAKCFYGTNLCSEERACAVHEFWSDLRTRVEAFLRDTTVALTATSGWPERPTPIGIPGRSSRRGSGPGTASRFSDPASQPLGRT